MFNFSQSKQLLQYWIFKLLTTEYISPFTPTTEIGAPLNLPQKILAL